MAQLFKKGDVVYLKSGSTPMTVRMYDTIPDGFNKFKESEDMLTCEWFIYETSEMKSKSFQQDMLTSIDPT